MLTYLCWMLRSILNSSQYVLFCPVVRSFVAGAQEYSSRTAGVTVGTAIVVIVLLTLVMVCIASYVIQRKLEEEQRERQKEQDFY